MEGGRNEQDDLSPLEIKCCKDHVNMKQPENKADMEGNRQKRKRTTSQAPRMPF